MLRMLKGGWWNVRAAALGLVVIFCAGCTSDLPFQTVENKVYLPGQTETRINSARQYFDDMCARTPGCSPHDWEAITWTAINDIDERCGQYLSSLDTARRDSAYWNRTITDVSTSTKSILGFTNPGLTALTIVGELFEFGRLSVNEYYSRIILSEEPTVVERIVRKLQNQYRIRLASLLRKYRIDDTGAQYAVRGYLRLCLPVTIEAELQAVKTNVDYNRDSDRVTWIKETPALKVLDALPVVMGGGSRPPPADDTPVTRPDPVRHQMDYVELRDRLCLPTLPANQTPPGADVVEEMKQFREARKRFGEVPGPNPKPDAPSDPEVVVLRAVSPGHCTGAFKITTYERFAFTTEQQTGCPAKPDQKIERSRCLHAMLAVALQKLASGSPDIRDFQSAEFTMKLAIDATTRKAVKKFTDLCPAALKAGDDPQIITSGLAFKLLNVVQTGESPVALCKPSP